MMKRFGDSEMGEVWRSGESSSSHIVEKKAFKKKDGNWIDIPVIPIISGGSALDSDKSKGINISFSIASKGGGRTTLKVWLHPSDFISVAEAMIRVNRVEAENAFRSASKNPNRSMEEFLIRNAEEQLSKLKAEQVFRDDDTKELGYSREEMYRDEIQKLRRKHLTEDNT